MQEIALFYLLYAFVSITTLGFEVRFITFLTFFCFFNVFTAMEMTLVSWISKKGPMFNAEC